MKCRKCSEESASLAAQALAEGKIVVIPTDTVYGFSGIVDLKGKNTSSTDAAIRRIKGREENKPMIHLIADPEDVKKYTDDEISESLLNKWPGPLTVIVKVKEDSPLSQMTGTVAFRCPGDEWLRNVIRQCGAPIYSTSVNRTGSPVLDSISEICNEFESDVSLIVDDGDKKGGIPSTIVSVEQGKVCVIRQGAVEIM